MPHSNVRWPIPLLRLNPWYPGQMGVPGTDSETGLRTDSHGAVFYVDPNAVGVSDQRDGTDPQHPLRTVAAALTHCSAYHGDTIAVMANNGWYYNDTSLGRTTFIAEEVTVTVPGVRIVGVSPGGTLGTIWTPASNGGTCITVHATDVTIEGFTFTEGDYTGCDGIECVWDGTATYGENTVIRYCMFDDTVDTAIEMEYSWYNHIHDCWFMECDLYGIYTAAAGAATYGTVIERCYFTDVGTSAIALLGGADACLIDSCWIYNGNAEAGAAATNEGINTTGGTNNIVTNCYLSCLLPVPANGDLDDLNTAAATDSWIGNHCLNGLQITQPT